jgi:hypothetical protein
MRLKSIHLLLLFCFSSLSCSAPLKIYSKKEEAAKYFVKILIEVEVTKCEKKANSKNNKPCEKKKSLSTGSGMIVDISSRHQNQIVLSAGHVCDSRVKNSETETHTYTTSEIIRVVDRNSYEHGADIILSSLPPEGGDLCSLYVPTLKYLDPEGKSKISLSLKKPGVGEDVYYVGAPWGIYHPPAALFLQGVFSGNIDELSSLVSIPAAPGASGSVLLSSRNKIYGVVFAVHPVFQHATIATSYEETKRFIIETKRMIGDL